MADKPRLVLGFTTKDGTGLKGFEPLTYRCPSDAFDGAADKSRSLNLAKLQARGRAYRTPRIKRYVEASPVQLWLPTRNVELPSNW